MKKIIIFILLFMFLGSFAIVNATSSEKFYTIVCNPGEESANEMRINWHTDLGVVDSYVVYTKKSDTEWKNRLKAENEFFVNKSFTQLNAIGNDLIQNGAVLKNLESGTEYMYKITDGKEESEVGYFKTSNSSFSFIWSSDFHAYYDDARRLNNATKNIEEAININGGVDFILSTGDYIAHGGTYKWWKQVSEASWMKKYMFASTLGNHDWMTSKGTTKALGASHNFFSAFQNNPKNGYSGQENVCYYFYYGDALFVVMNTEEYTQAQYDWVESVLKKANSQYIFLVQHYQAFGPNGSKNSAGYTRWHNLCDKYGVDVFFSGNSHVYIRSNSIYNDKVSEDETKGTVYMVAPSSDGDRGSTFPGISNNKDLIAYGWAGGTTQVACSIVSVNEGGITTKLINKGGEILDHNFIKAKRHATSRTTHSLGDFDKYNFEKEISVSVNSKDINKPRVKISADGYNVLKNVKISNEVTGDVYYNSKTIQNMSYLYLDSVPKGIIKMKIELYYYDNVIKTIYRELKNTPKWGSLSNIKYIVNENKIDIKWVEKISIDTIKSFDLYVNDKLFKSIDPNICEVSIPNLEFDTNYNISIKVIENDGTILDVYSESCKTEVKKWKVEFLDINGNVISTQYVASGESAEEVIAPNVNGYEFLNWDKSFANIESDLVIKPIYEKIIKYYIVKFIDENGKILKEEKVEEGKSATPPLSPTKEGYKFVSWDKLFTNIESDLVIKPIYEKIEEEKKESCKNGATIVFTSLLLLGLCFIRRRKY